MIYPDIYAPYPNRATHYVYLTIRFVISFAVTAALAIIVLSRYHQAKLKSEELVKKLGEISITDPLTAICTGTRSLLSWPGSWEASWARMTYWADMAGKKFMLFL